MAVRTTEAAVKKVRPTSSDVGPMILAASFIVDDLVLDCGASFTDARLKEIETWLAAHFVGTIDPTLTKEKFENAENTYHVGSDSLSGIMSDKYGQTANMLSKGCLVEFDKQQASVDFLS